MKKFIITCCIALIYSTGAVAQASDPNSTIEDRVSALEKRVKELETQLQQLSTTSKPSNRPGENTKPSTTDKPTEQDIVTAISNSLKKSVPVTWAGNLMGGSNGVVKTVSIQEWGVYNDKYGYWPVKVRVVGSCEVDNMFSKETKNFDKVGSFKLKKDDFGNWTAEYSEAF